mgnify:CR=1 FL=1
MELENEVCWMFEKRKYWWFEKCKIWEKDEFVEGLNDEHNDLKNKTCEKKIEHELVEGFKDKYIML